MSAAVRPVDLFLLCALVCAAACLVALSSQQPDDARGTIASLLTAASDRIASATGFTTEENSGVPSNPSDALKDVAEGVGHIAAAIGNAADAAGDKVGDALSATADGARSALHDIDEAMASPHDGKPLSQKIKEEQPELFAAP